MSKKKKIVRLIRCFKMGSFPPIVMFCIGFSGEQIMTHLKKQKAKDWIAGIKGEEDYINKCKYVAMYREIVSTETERPTKKLYYLIFTEPFMFTDNSYSILAHEVLHVVQFALKDILNINDETEAFAYTHTFVMDKCMKLIRGKK